MKRLSKDKEEVVHGESEARTNASMANSEEKAKNAMMHSICLLRIMI